MLLFALTKPSLIECCKFTCFIQLQKCLIYRLAKVAICRNRKPVVLMFENWSHKVDITIRIKLNKVRENRRVINDNISAALCYCKYRL